MKALKGVKRKIQLQNIVEIIKESKVFPGIKYSDIIDLNCYEKEVYQNNKRFFKTIERSAKRKIKKK